MKGYDLFELAVRNLRQSKLRNGLTTVGISVGVASLVAMLSLGVGLQQLATRRLAGSGMFERCSSPRSRIFAASIAKRTRRNQHPEKAPVLDEAARDKMAQLPIRHRGRARDSRDGRDRLWRPDAFRICHRPAHVGAGERSLRQPAGQVLLGHDADEVILLKDFAKELDPKDPTRADRPGRDAALRRAPGAAAGLADRPQMLGRARAEPTCGNGDDFGFSVVRKTQKLKVVGIIDEEPYGGMRTVSRGPHLPAGGCRPRS